MLYRCLYQSSNMGTNISYLDNMFHIPKYVYEDSKRNCNCKIHVKNSYISKH